MPPVLSAHKLTKRFKELVAVDNVSLDVAQGEILGLLGPNGAGKTTTFQMLLGILTPTSGTIHFFGKNFETHRNEILERVNFSSTYTNLPWNLKVRDNLAFMNRLYSLSNREARLAEIIETFRLQSLLSKEVISLSAGELTRLNLAKAFINDPDVVLLDEPTASLDPESAHVVREFIMRRRSERGMSVLFTSHNMSEVEAVCDRVVFIHRGAIIANDTPGNLARTLDRCSVSLMAEQDKEVILKEVCTGFGLEMSMRESQCVIDMKEELVPQFLTSVTARGVSLHGLTVNRATLEDYFLSRAKEKEVRYGS